MSVTQLLRTLRERDSLKGYRNEQIVIVRCTQYGVKSQASSVISVKQPLYHVIINFCWGGGGGRGRLQAVIRACSVPPGIQTGNAKLKLRELGDLTKPGLRRLLRNCSDMHVFKIFYW